MAKRGFQRDDIYFCDCCLEFYDRRTHVKVDVPYTEMPAELAVTLLTARMGAKAKRPHRQRRKK